MSEVSSIEREYFCKFGSWNYRIKRTVLCYLRKLTKIVAHKSPKPNHFGCMLIRANYLPLLFQANYGTIFVKTNSNAKSNNWMKSTYKPAIFTSLMLSWDWIPQRDETYGIHPVENFIHINNHCNSMTQEVSKMYLLSKCTNWFVRSNRHHC